MSFRTKSADSTIVDRPSTWKDLLDFSAEMSEQPHILYGLAVAGNIILTISDDIDAAQDWAFLDGSKQ